MRIVVAAVGRLKAGPDHELAERYCDRVTKTGRAVGIAGIDVVEVRESRAREAERRIVEESIALANIIPEGAVVAMLDRRGENLDSDAFAGRLRAWRDSGRHNLCFMIGGSEGLGGCADRAGSHSRFRRRDVAASACANHAAGADLSGADDPVGTPLSSRLTAFRWAWRQPQRAGLVW